MSELTVNFRKGLREDVMSTILFGLLSVILGLVQFKIPGFENSYSDLREIPLLISLFYLRNPIFVLAVSLIQLIATPVGVPYVGNFLMHLIPLLITWFIYQQIIKRNFHNILLGVIWGVITLIYYMFMLFPVLILSYQWVGVNTEISFVESYTAIAITSLFEIITTTLVSSLFLIQYDIRKVLENQNHNLEEIVRARTRELSESNHELQAVNEELIATNEEVQALNENLERLVQERTEKITHQLNQLVRYAHMNSHEVRAPLARILGILGLLKVETNEHLVRELLDKLQVSSTELDVVIREMNRLLEKEIPQE